MRRGVTGLRPGTLCFCKTFGFCILFWQCLLGGRLGPPFFPAGKESAAGGVKKGGQGGLPMGPLDDPPTANKGGVRAPFFGLIPRGSVGAVPCDCAGGASWICFVLRRGKALRCCPFFVGSWFLGGAVPAKTWQGSWFLSWGHCLHLF